MIYVYGSTILKFWMQQKPVKARLVPAQYTARACAHACRRAHTHVVGCACARFRARVAERKVEGAEEQEHAGDEDDLPELRALRPRFAPLQLLTREESAGR